MADSRSLTSYQKHATLESMGTSNLNSQKGYYFTKKCENWFLMSKFSFRTWTIVMWKIPFFFGLKTILKQVILKTILKNVNKFSHFSCFPKNFFLWLLFFHEKCNLASNKQKMNCAKYDLVKDWCQSQHLRCQPLLDVKNK